jgi:hypothetical protein
MELAVKHLTLTEPTLDRARSAWSFGVEQLHMELEPSQTGHPKNEKSHENLHMKPLRNLKWTL